MATAWRTLGVVEPRTLAEARILLHHAAQLATAPGRSLLPARPDDSQTAFEWRDDLQALVGAPIPGSPTWRAALRPADTALLLVVDEGVTALPIQGRTLEDGFSWLREQTAAHGTDVTRLSRAMPYELPDHPVATGAPFPREPRAAFAELGRCFANADLVLRGAAATQGASTVRCWPHHFDLAALVTLDPAAGADSPTVGLGFSPGDEGIPEPYYYVNAWPRPSTLPEPLPPLPAGGRWNVEGWLGAVLTVSTLVSADHPEAQEARAREFFAAAGQAARGLLELP
jgi:hypothetical protein